MGGDGDVGPKGPLVQRWSASRCRNGPREFAGRTKIRVTHNYSYNAIGNILEKAGVLYSYTNPLHPSAVTSTSDGKSYTYDQNGNMVSGGNRTYIWDPDNRLDTVTTGGASSFMSYDYTGIRVKKDGSGGITTYPFSGYEIAPNGVTTKYIRIGIENVAAKKSTGISGDSIQH